MQQLIDRERAGFRLAAWDWDFYAEKVRRERYAFDESQLKPYLELDRVLKDGVFFAATRLFGITFRERRALPVYEPTVRVFDVLEADGTPLAIFLADLYARPSKRGGAWMNSYVDQSGLLGTRPVVANHMNIPKPVDGAPTLLTFDEVNPETSYDVWVAPLDLTRPDQPVVGKPEPLVRSRAGELFGQFSPDGKWLAYGSDENGTNNVYVRPFPGPGAARNVSRDGGIYMAWAKNGQELLFTRPGGQQVMAVDYRVSGGDFIASPPRVWSNARIRAVGAQPSLALHPDGKRIAMFPREEASAEGAAQRE